MNRKVFGLLALGCFCVAAWAAGSKATGYWRAGTQAVVVELFTSEGCDSCPPAELVLAKLQRQPVAGAQIISLGFHVDYWNQLGWIDRFSNRFYSDRQRAYAKVFRSERIYTPQMIVDGRTEFVGSNEATALKVIRESAARQKTPINLQLRGFDPTQIAVSIEEIPADGSVWLAVTEDGLISNITRGENEGKVLTHMSVVRNLRRLASVRKGQKFSSLQTLRDLVIGNPRNARIAVFLQQGEAGPILGAASVSVLPTN